MTSIVSLVGWIAACFVVAGVGSIPTARALKDWYPKLEKPSWSPPNWLFGPVWTLLYILMAVAAWLVWREDSPVNPIAIRLFVAQLVLNGLWSWIFFGWRLIGLALAEVILLWFSIAMTLWAFYQVNPLAGLLMAPYLCWVTFASCLNLAYWLLNRDKMIEAS